MRPQVCIHIACVVVFILIVWTLFHSPPYMLERTRDIQSILAVLNAPTSAPPKKTAKCDLDRECPFDHFAFSLMSGAANVVGPKICFDGKIVMSGVRNNVGPGLNIVLVNGETGTVEHLENFNMNNGKTESVLDFLKNVKPGTIVLLASYDEPATKMTDELREAFSQLGSSMAKSIQYRDNWVFAGGRGLKDRTPFEKLNPNDKKSNIFDGWPEVAYIMGCFPRSIGGGK